MKMIEKDESYRLRKKHEKEHTFENDPLFYAQL